MGDYNPYRLSRVRPSAPRKREYPEWGKLLAEVVDPAEHWFALVYGEAYHIEQYGIEITEDILRNILVRFHEDWMKQLEVINEENRELDRERQISIVYYMRIGDRVKIGTTTNLKRRRAEINPEELLATEPGWYDREEQRHLQFAHLRTHGEWFRLEGELQDHIDELRSQAAQVDNPLTS